MSASAMFTTVTSSVIITPPALTRAKVQRGERGEEGVRRGEEYTGGHLGHTGRPGGGRGSHTG
ncbi:hypothetical protein GCM10017752_60850 [Streptomyces roseoviridis]